MLSFRYIKRTMSCLLVIMLCLTISSPAALAVTDSNTITINNLEEFEAFAKKCSLDTWSRGKSVTLSCDLDLTDCEYKAIATFGGTFDGTGHIISNIKLNGSGSIQGLFRNIQSGATVKNLTVKGEISPKGSKSTIGGIAGSNAGTILNCSFSGSVNGDNTVGGIAGVNLESGKIISCSSSGTISANKNTGGICGKNLGIIKNCNNAASVNTTEKENKTNLSDVYNSIDFTLNNLSLSRIEEAQDSVASYTDTGGIVGYSVGIVQDCVNRGTVGFPHTGYNIGGVAGRQAGYMLGCSNSGEVFGRKDVGGIVGQAEPNVILNASGDVLSRLAKELGALHNLVDTALVDLDTSSTEIADYLKNISQGSYFAQDISKSLLDMIGNFIGNSVQDPADIESIIDNLETSAENYAKDDYRTISGNLYASFENLVNEMDGLKNTMSSSSKSLMSNLHKINDQFNVVMMLMISAMDSITNAKILDFSQYYNDTSDKEISKTILGKVKDCINSGPVQADRNAGGISGSMAIEYILDPEDDVDKPSFLNATYETKAILINCINRGEISGKKDCIGGLVGRMELGIASDCENYGLAESKEGSYVGGIAGWSGSTIQRCFTKCSLSGMKFIGGIAGSGKRIRGCYTIVQFDAGEEYLGAIAGEGDNTDSGIKNNFYVDEGVAAVDDISYFECAEPISFNELKKTEGVPKEFVCFTVTFKADDKPIETLAVEYGQRLDRLELPEIPQKSGCFGYWEAFESYVLTGNVVINAVYLPWVTVLSSKETQTDTGLSLALAEGKFTDKAVLHVTESVLKAPVSAGEGEISRVWIISLQGAKLSDTKSVPIRMLNETGGDVRAWKYEKGDWKELKINKRGQYSELTMEGTSGTYSFLYTPPPVMGWKYYAMRALVAAPFIILIIFVAIYMRKTKVVVPDDLFAFGLENIEEKDDKESITTTNKSDETLHKK